MEGVEVSAESGNDEGTGALAQRSFLKDGWLHDYLHSEKTL